MSIVDKGKADKNKDKKEIESQLAANLAAQSKKFRAEITKTPTKDEIIRASKPTRSKIDPKLRHAHCVDERELREEIADYLLSLRFQKPKTPHEKTCNAQTEYLVNEIRTKGTIY